MPKTGPTKGAERQTPVADRWESHPWIARFLRVLIALIPMVLTMSFTWSAGQLYPPESVGLNPWVWVAAVFAIATVLLLALRRVFHQLTPLVGLMSLTLVFPDQAPSRAKATLRKSSSRTMLREMEEARAKGDGSGQARHGDYLMQLLSEVNEHDRLTRGHSERVRAYAEMIGEELKLTSDEMNKLRWSALLHDVGKLEVPYEILNKTDRPTEEEWSILSSHPTHGGAMLEPLREWLGDWIHSADQHHCRWDGEGYPSGLSGEDITLAGRIVAVADAYDVMTSTRSYKKPLSAEAARQELTDCAGTQFDPAMVRAFLNISLGRLRAVAGPFGWLLHFLASAQVKVPVATAISSGATSAAAVVGVVAVGVLPSGPPETLAMVEEAVPIEVEDVGSTGLEDQAIEVSLRAQGGSGEVRFTVEQAMSGRVNVEDEGSARQVGNRWTQTVWFNPDLDFYGLESFSFQACDAEGQCEGAFAHVLVQAVNDAPQTAGDTAVIGSQQTALVDAVANDRDPEGHWLTLTAVEQPATGEALLVDGKILYVPEQGFSGTVTVYYTVTDQDGATSRGTLVVEVLPDPPAEPIVEPEPTPPPPTTPLNMAPVAAADSATTDEDTSVLIDVLSNDTDPDADDVLLVSVGAATNGTVVIEGNRVRYQPNADYHGEDRFTYVISDGVHAPVVADVAITVTSINDAPTISGPLSAALDETTPVGATVLAVAVSDRDGDTLSTTIASGDTDNRFVIDGDGRVTVAAPLDYETTPSYNLRLEVTDGTATSTLETAVQVGDINEAPMATDDGGAGFSTSEDTPFITASVIANDSDVDNPIDPASITVTNGLANGALSANGDGTFTVTPDPEWSGTDSFRYTVTDAGSLSSNEATVTVQVDDVNDPPVITNPGALTVAEETPFTLPFSATDVEGHGLVFTATGLPAGLGINASGLVSGAADPGTQGTHNVTVTVTDAGTPAAVTSVSFTVTVDHYLLSPEAGDVVINEVLYNSVSVTAPEEFVELTNRSAAAIDLTGWVLADANLKVDGSQDLAYTIPATDHWGTASSLLPGQYAIVWLVYDGANLPPLRNSGSGLEYVVNASGAKLYDGAEGIWLNDASTRVVDFMAYGTGSQVGTLPDVGLGLWDGTHQATLVTAAGQSLAVTPDGTDANSSACWEPTGSDDAIGRCAGAVSTYDTDEIATLTSSVGRGNNAAGADAGGAYAITEGDALTLDGSGSIGASTWAWDLDNDGQYDDATGASPTVAWATLATLGIGDDGTYPVGVEVDGGEDTATTSLNITNLAPVLNTTGSGSVSTGGTYTLNLSVTDPGADVITGWTINWGDGSIETVAGNPTSITHVYNGAGRTYNVLAAASDEDGSYIQNELVTPSYDKGEVFRYGIDAGFSQRFATGTLPIDAIVGPDGLLYVSGQTSDNVQRYNADTGAFVDEFIAAGTGGLASANGLAFGPDGNLYVVDYNGQEVLRFNGTTGAFIDVFASTGFSGPYDLAFGPDGNLYVNDFNDSNVRRFNGTTGAFIDVFVTPGSGGLDTPEQMAFGPDGNLYIASTNTDEVLRYNGTTGAFIDVFVAAGGAADLDEPTGLAFGPDGNLYVADFVDNVVLRFNGTTGAFIDQYITPGLGGLTDPVFLTFLPDHQVSVTP